MASDFPWSTHAAPPPHLCLIASGRVGKLGWQWTGNCGKSVSTNSVFPEHITKVKSTHVHAAYVANGSRVDHRSMERAPSQRSQTARGCKGMCGTPREQRRARCVAARTGNPSRRRRDAKHLWQVSDHICVLSEGFAWTTESSASVHNLVLDTVSRLITLD